VTDKDGIVIPIVIEESDQIAGQLRDVIGGDLGRSR
jgi:hypothetical protein